MINPIQELLDDLHRRFQAVHEGEIASYIPELAHADRDSFGLAVATLDGHLYEAGDSSLPFTIQSVSKPFVYALALADRGPDAVLARVGVQPMGEAFNSITLESDTGRPLNPMVNAGAIVMSSLVAGVGFEAQFERILAGLSEFAGRSLDLDERVLASEQSTGDRNRAIAYLMRNAGSLSGDVEEVLSVYFRQCSIRVTTRDLAVMAATLANQGVNPLSGRAVVAPLEAGHTLIVMGTCGMYDYAGEWLFRVGWPAKSGVSGGIAAALPLQFGIGIFSPPLDRFGNSVRGIALCEELSARLGLHLLRPERRSAPVVYWSTRENGVLTLALQGGLGFAEAESVVRNVLADADSDSTRGVILDLNRVGHAQSIALSLLDALVRRLKERGIVTVVVDQLGRCLIDTTGYSCVTLDEALAWIRNELLARGGSH
jgi:glutaminase